MPGFDDSGWASAVPSAEAAEEMDGFPDFVVVETLVLSPAGWVVPFCGVVLAGCVDAACGCPGVLGDAVLIDTVLGDAVVDNVVLGGAVPALAALSPTG